MPTKLVKKDREDWAVYVFLLYICIIIPAYSLHIILFDSIFLKDHSSMDTHKILTPKKEGAGGKLSTCRIERNVHNREDSVLQKINKLSLHSGYSKAPELLRGSTNKKHCAVQCFFGFTPCSALCKVTKVKQS